MNDNLAFTPKWHRRVLAASALHSGIWGVFILTMPATAARVYGFNQTPTDLHLWLGTGLFICLLAFGYGLAARNPNQHWGLVLIGLLAKVLGAIGMTHSALSGQISLNVLRLLPINDAIWWIPFAIIVKHAHKQTTQANTIDQTHRY